MTKTTVLTVPDMTCGHCEMSVKEALADLPGVEGVEADHVTGRVEVSHEEGGPSGQQFGQAVEGAGYTLAS